jgi:hypothetical protein
MKLKPPEMERVHLHLKGDFSSGKVEIFMEGVKGGGI